MKQGNRLLLLSYVTKNGITSSRPTILDFSFDLRSAMLFAPDSEGC